MKSAIDALLRPFAGGIAAGRDPASTDLLQRIQQLRKEAREQPDGQLAGWNAVAGECVRGLSEVGKDLRLAGFLLEASIYTDGFRGLRDGLQLTVGLVSGFWDTLHPGLVDGTVDGPLRSAPLGFIGSSQPLLLAVKRCPLLASSGARLDWLAYEQSRLSDADERLWNDWQAAFDATPPESLEAMAEQLGDCAEVVGRLRSACNDRLGSTGVNWNPLTELIEQIRDVLASRDGKRVEIPATAAQATRGGIALATRSESATAIEPGRLQSRQDAFRELRRIAVFLRQTDPHSPISFLLDRAVRWSEMPLDKLLLDIVKVEEARGHIWETLGLPRAGSEGTPP